jgi:hypothetical protein
MRRVKTMYGAGWGRFEAGLRVAGWLGLVVLLLAGWRMRADLPLAGLSDGDTWGYLMPAMSFLSGDGIVDVQEREWVYPAFVAAAIRVTGSFQGFLGLQQALGMLAVLPLWLVWRGWISMLPPSPLLRIFGTACGLLVAAVYLLNPHLILFERSIRPETLMIAAALAQLCCMVAYCRFRWLTPSATLSVLAGAGAILLAWFIFRLRPSWAFAVPVTILPVGIGVFGRGLPAAARWAAPALGAALALLLVWLPEHLFFVKSGNPRTVLPMTLFTMNAATIRDTMVAQIEGGNLPEERASLYREVVPILDSDLGKACGMLRHYPRVGFDPDYLMYRASLFPWLVSTRGYGHGDLARFCYAAYFDAWRGNPLGMAGKISNQMAYFVRPDPLTFTRKRIRLGEQFAHSLTVLPESLPADEVVPWVAGAYGAHRKRLREAAGITGAKIESFRPLHKFLEDSGRFALWIVAGFAVSLVAAFVVGGMADLRLPGLVALVLFGAPAANALTVAVVHALDNSRYRASYGPLLFLALTAMVVFTVAVAGRALRRNLPGRSPEEQPVQSKGKGKSP